MIQPNEVDSLLDAAAEFLIALRTGEGIQEPAYRKLCGALHDCADEWKNLDVIPKRAANLLVDLYPGIEASSHLYTGDEAERIIKAADTIAALIRECVAVEAGDPVPRLPQ